MNVFKIIIFAAMLLVGVRLLFVTPRHADPDLRDRVIIDYWEKWGGDEAAAMQHIIDWFNDTVGREKGIYVRYLSMSNIQQKTLVSTAAGVPPDVAGIFEAQLVQFASLDALEPLDELAAEHGITAGHYKPVYWNMCTHNDRLYALVSVPSSIGLHYNKRIFRENADALGDEGLDPNRAPRTIHELDRYARVLDTFDPRNPRRIDRAGFLPLQPDWFLNYYPYWFGGDFFDAESDRFTFDSDPGVRRCLEWMYTYAQRLGIGAMNEFSSGFGQFASTQNPFFAGKVTMTLQGPWMANFIQLYRPEMSEVIVPKVLEPYLSRNLRRHNYDWGVEAFPSEVPGLKDVAYCGADLLVIPRGARHKREAFEFIAFVNRQDVAERLAAMQTKPTALNAVSDEFIRTHPNPYMDVFERLARSPNAKGVQPVAILPEMTQEVNYIIARLFLNQGTVDQLLRGAQRRLEASYQQYKQRQRARGL